MDKAQDPVAVYSIGKHVQESRQFRLARNGEPRQEGLFVSGLVPMHQRRAVEEHKSSSSSFHCRLRLP